MTTNGRTCSGDSHTSRQPYDIWGISCDHWTWDVSIATQLKRLEEAFTPSNEDTPAVLKLNAEDSDTLKKVFSLAPQAFVDAWARALSLTGADFTAADK